jgi:lysophospholipase L1-like esterase
MNLGIKLLHAPVLALTLSVPSQAARVYIDAANEVAINGESFFGASNIRDELTRLARRDSVIAPTATFRQIAVSGALISQIQGYYKNAVPKPKYVISDGGGNDLMSTCPAPAASSCPVVQTTFNAVRVLFDSMAAGGTQRVLWMRYPDPQGANWATLKTNQDLFNPLVKTLCDTIKSLKCFWIDLRPVWDGHYAQYTTDGIHATNAGGTATAEAFWKVIVDSNFFGGTATGVRTSPRGAPEARIDFVTGRLGAGFRVRISEAGYHVVEILDASGREIALRKGQGPADYRFEAKQAGLYFVRMSAGGKSFVRKVLAGE